MNAKKRLRQEQRKEKERLQNELNRPTVLLKKDDTLHGNYRWNCPNHEGTFSWSKSINAMWGHPEDKVFCAVCFKYYDIEFAPVKPKAIVPNESARAEPLTFEPSSKEL